MAMSGTKATAMSTRSPTIKRILREAAEISNSPSPDYDAQPLETDLFEWHFTLRGPPNSVYSEGMYHGRIVLPATYPLRPPMFRFATPNGRFEANREICLSISGHHEETWQPAWGVRTALVALRSFMETEVKGQLGGLEAPKIVRERLAKESGGWTCTTCAKSNAEIMKACGQRCQESTTETKDVAVPQELKMAWKDEMLDKSPEEESDDQHASTEDGELAEGFVQTLSAPQRAMAFNREGGITPPVRRQLTGQDENAQDQNMENTAPTVQQRVPVAANSQRATDEAIPLWIDRAIVVLVVLLVALLLKVLFAC